MLNTTSTNVSNNELISCNPNAIYGDVDHHICCLIPIYIDGGDYTACYYVDGRREIVHKSIKTVMKEVAHHEGVLQTAFNRRGGQSRCIRTLEQ